MPDGGVITPGVPAVRLDCRSFRQLSVSTQALDERAVVLEYEGLHEPADLVRWAAESRLPAGLEPAVSAEELTAARTLRNALWRLTADRAHGRELRRADLAVVNEAAAQAPPAPRITADGERGWAPGATGTQLLSVVARDAVDLFTGPYAHRIRECGSHDCYLLFVDTSRPGRRRWCAMERCGNRNKVRAHRVRHTEHAEGDGR
jgi:predicted RNA-binding Zn ribbon-like protein